MPRPVKTGLDYFSFDVDFFDDEKIQFISARFGLKGEIIVIKLLCKIYRNGFYTKFDEDEQLLFASRAGEGVTPALVKDVVAELVKRGFFDKGIFNRFKVITSNGIQKRFFSAVERRVEQNFPKEYLLGVNVCNNPINVDNNSINDGRSTQSKVKESKVKERINKSVDLFLELFPKVLSEFPDFEKSWIDWVNYRKQLKKTLTEISAKRQLEFLSKQSNPVKVIEQSIMNQWQGLFELKTGNYNGASSKHNNAGSTGTGGDFTDPANAKYKYL